MSNTIVAQIRTYDKYDIAATGWTLTLYSDGPVAAELRNPWQGQPTGIRYRSAPDRVTISALGTHTDDDAEAALWQLARDEAWDEDVEDWRMTRGPQRCR